MSAPAPWFPSGVGHQCHAVADLHVRSRPIPGSAGPANSGGWRRVSCKRGPAISAGISDSVGTMKIRATLFSIAKLAVVVTVAAACGGHQGNKVLADTPVLPYQSPDIAEITGIEEPEEDAEESEAPPAAPAPAPAPAAATPPAPAPAPAPAPKAAAPAKKK